MGHCLVGACLIFKLVMCAGWPRCSYRVSELGGALERLLWGWWVRLRFH